MGIEFVAWASCPCGREIEGIVSENIAVNCPSCGNEYDLPRDYVAQYAGHEAPCEACGGTFVVPENEDALLAVDESDVEPAVAGSPIPLSYASPSVAEHPSRFPAWRVGYDVVVLRGGTLPQRCVVCAEPVNAAPKLLQFRWRGNWGGVAVILMLVPFVRILYKLAITQNGYEFSGRYSAVKTVLD